MDVHHPYIRTRKGFQLSQRFHCLNVKERGDITNKATENEKRELIKAYDDEIKHVDYLIGKLLAKLQALNVIQKTEGWSKFLPGFKVTWKGGAFMTNPTISCLTGVILSTLEEKRGVPGIEGKAGKEYILMRSSLSSW